MTVKYQSRTFFSYEVDDDTALAPAASVALTFNTQGDSDFFWQKFVAFTLVAGAATTRPNEQLPAINITVTNATTGRTYNQLPVPISLLSSYQQWEPLMTVWPRKTTVLINLKNVSVGTTYSRIQLTFLGTKAFTST